MALRLGRPLLIAGALAALSAAVACFSLNFVDGTLRCSSDPERLCPSGYRCISEYCWAHPDFGSDGGDGMSELSD
jgi:hypothetical protein